MRRGLRAGLPIYLDDCAFVCVGAQGTGLSGDPHTAHKLSLAEKLSLQAGRRVGVAYRVTIGKNVRLVTASTAPSTTVVVAICTS